MQSLALTESGRHVKADQVIYGMRCADRWLQERISRKEKEYYQRYRICEGPLENGLPDQGRHSPEILPAVRPILTFWQILMQTRGWAFASLHSKSNEILCWLSFDGLSFA